MVQRRLQIHRSYSWNRASTWPWAQPDSDPRAKPDHQARRETVAARRQDMLRGDRVNTAPISPLADA